MDKVNIVCFVISATLILLLVVLFVADAPRIKKEREVCESMGMDYDVQGPMAPSVCIDDNGQMFLVDRLKERRDQ